MHGNKDWSVSKLFQEIVNLDRIDGDPVEFEENSFPGFHTLQFSEEVKSLVFRKGETFETITGRNFSCRCSMTFFVKQKTTKKNVWRTMVIYWTRL